MKKQSIIISIVLAGAILIPALIFAAPAETYTVPEVISNITNWIVGISLGLATLMYVVAGFLWMSDAGNAEKVKTAKSIIISTTIGLVVILMANAIISIVRNIVVK